MSDLSIRSDRLSASIATMGAELQTIRDAEGRDLQWDGDPAFWTGRAPILFPIVGRLIGDTYRLDGKTYQMGQHGFARKKRFTVIAHEEARVTLRLDADDETRAIYPFDFRLDVTAEISGETLTLSATVANRGDGEMPASFGFHPAFRWPLPHAGARADYQVVFAEPEPEPIRRLAADGGVDPAPVPTPIDGRVLHVRDDLFTNDAIIMPAPRSRLVRYGAPGERGLQVSFPAMPMLGIWTKPGAGYLCIEPWQGHADPAGYSGDFRNKPGMLSFAPGESRTFAIVIRLVEQI